MKKLLGIVVLGLMLSGNAYAEIIKKKSFNNFIKNDKDYENEFAIKAGEPF